jgi:ribosome biogenesis protein BMS1
MIKYTPKHLHCDAHIWGPVTRQGTGFLAVQSVSEVKARWRFCGTPFRPNFNFFVKKLQVFR